MRKTVKSSWQKIGSLFGAVAMVVAISATAFAVPGDNTAPKETASKSVELVCPPTWTWPPIHNDLPSYIDYNLAVYVGGDFRVEGSSAEAEGRVWVGGETVIDRQPPSRFNLGRVGVGSQVAPPPGATMLLTGRSFEDDLSISDGNLLDIGHGIDTGGDVQVAGGVIPDVSRVETNGGVVKYEMGSEATDQYVGFSETLKGLSSYLNSQSSNGSLVVRGNQLHFTGTGEAGVLQVFDVDAKILGQPTVELYFQNIPDETAVAINVLGADASFNPVWIQDGNERVDYFGSPGFAKVAVRTLWNFHDASSLGLLGTSQILGSILAMEAEETFVSASTNGRLYVGGDLVLNGTGNELHNYHWPWSPETECIEEPDPESPGGIMPVRGMVSVVKQMYGEATVSTTLNTGQKFVGVGHCASMPEFSEPARGFRWVASPGQVASNDGLLVGQECVLQEMTPKDPPAEGLEWGEPMMDPEDGTVIVDNEPQQIDVFVDNVALGRFFVGKQVIGPDGTSEGFNDNRTFTIDYSCSLSGPPTEGFDSTNQRVPGSSTGTLTVSNGQTVESLNFAHGTKCELSERLTSVDGEFDGNYQWSKISWSPSNTVTIVAGDLENRLVTVTNIFEAPKPELAQFEVHKELQTIGGGVADLDRVFSINYSCTFNGEPTIGYDPVSNEVVAPNGAGNFTIKHGQQVASPAFQLGTICELEEEQEGSVNDGFRWAKAEFIPSNQVVVDDQTLPTTVQAINTLVPVEEPMASFNVKKEIVGPDGSDNGFINSQRTFLVDYVCTIDGGPSMGYDLDGQTVISADGTGVLRLRADGVAVDSPQFVVGTSCDLFEDLVAYGNDFIDRGHQWSESIFIPDSTVLLEEENTTLSILLANHFTVEELEIEPVFAQFSLSKTVDGPNLDVVNPNREFLIDYSCLFDGKPSVGFDLQGNQISSGTDSIRLQAGETIFGPYFRVGTECTFSETLTSTEDDFSDDDGNYRWSDVGFNQPMPIQITEHEGYPVQVVANNHFAAATDSGSFSVTKYVDGPNLAAVTAEPNFKVDYTCNRGGYPAIGYNDSGEVVAPYGVGTLSLTRLGSSVAAPVFRTGTSCHLREQLSGLEDQLVLPGYEWTASRFFPSDTVTITEVSSQPVSVSLTNYFSGPASKTTGPQGELAKTGTASLPLALASLLTLAGGVGGILVQKNFRRIAEKD